MTDLADFLLARIAEDEFGIVWGECRCGENTQRPDCPDRLAAECEAKRRIVEYHGPSTCGDEEGWDEFAAEYRENYGRDPIAHYPRGYCPGCDGCSSAQDADRDSDRTLRALAAVYADHPDYREEWAS